jgi:pimeloyl-ACP methyl ester carboxylesterase
LVLVHGGGFDSRCWDLMVPHLEHEALAVDLPGRGRSPAALSSLGIADFVNHVVTEIERRGLNDVVLVGHSMAGVTLPGVADAIPERLRRLVFVSCVVPAEGSSVLEALEYSAVEEQAAAVSRDVEPESTLDADLAEAIFCNDMDDEQRVWTIARLVPDAPGVIVEPVDLRGLRRAVPRTWVRLLQDAILPPPKQDVFIERVGGCDVVDIDAAHMAMISRPKELATVLDLLADA